MIEYDNSRSRESLSVATMDGVAAFPISECQGLSPYEASRPKAEYSHIIVIIKIPGQEVEATDALRKVLPSIC